MQKIDYHQITTETPTLDSMKLAWRDVECALGAAKSAESLAAVVDEWDTLRRKYETHSSLVQLHFEQDTRNPEFKLARETLEAFDPQVIELDTRIKRLLLDPGKRSLLEPILGQQVFALWQAEITTFAPAIKDDLVRESELVSQYTERLASARLSFDDEQHNLSTIIKFRQVADREQRYGAEKVLWDWFAEQGESLDRIYDELVHLRDKMARTLGFANFVELGYRWMNRIDYTEREVEQFRSEVRNHVVPLAVELRAQQAARLGVEPLMFWDEPLHDRQDNPRPLGDHDWMIARAGEMFDELGKPLGQFFRLMVEGDYLDLKAREGKADGGFCTSFSSYGMPYIFANFNGTKGDVEVFTHEMGHAYQFYESRGQRLLDYLWPTYESCEIHSMGLEFLSWPQMDKFFGPQAERFRTIHLTQGLLFLPYGVAVDHFQHLIYAEPNATPQQRHAFWQEMEALYLPWRNYGDLTYPSGGGRWQFQRHLYGSPFYYIDYTLAQTCALQFWLLAQQDASAAMEAYVALCRRGGSAPFQALVRGAGLKSPFEAGCLAEVVNQARQRLSPSSTVRPKTKKF